jgi:tetratricopeptide (TPR) repeat protein
MAKENAYEDRRLSKGLSRWKRPLIVAAVALIALGCSTPEEKAASYVKDGKELFQKGNYAQAGLQFRNALQLNNKLPDAWLYLGKIDLRNQKWDDAYKDLSRAVALDPNNTEALKELGSLQLGAGQVQDAMKTSESLLKLEPKNAGAHTLRGAVMYRLQNLDMAESEAKAALQIDPKHVDAMLLLARVDQSRGDADGALKVIKEGLAQNATNIPLQLVQIDILEAQGKSDEAVAAYNALIQQNPKERAYRNLLAAHYLKHKQPEQAQQVLEQAVRDFPDEVDAKIAVIRFAERYGNKEKAIELARSYAEQAPDATEIKFELARLLITDGQKDAGKKIYTDLAASDKNPVVIQAQTSLARLAIADGNSDEAEDRISKVLALDAHNGDALMLRAVLAMQQEKPADAVTYLNTVLTDSPNSAKALMLLGQAYMLRGQIELGKEQYYRAIEANPSDASIPVAFAQVLAQRQEYSQAESVLDRYLARDPNNLAALRAMAQIRLRKQDWLGAQQIAEKLKTLEGGHTTSEQIEGSVLQAQKKFGASTAIFQQLYSQNPNLQQPIAAVVQNYMQSGKKAEAKAFLADVLKGNPKNATANMLLGSVYEAEGEKGKADASFQAAIAAAPTSSEVRLRYAQVLVLRGDKDNALKVLNDGLVARPDDVVLMLGTALVQQYVGDFDKAIAEYENILKRQPRVDVAANNLASLLTDYRTDKESYQRALNLALRFRDSNIPYFLDTLGWAYFKLDMADDALTWLKKAVDGAPDAAILRYHLALAQLKTGNTAAAKQNLEMVVKSKDRSFQDMADAKAKLQSL